MRKGSKLGEKTRSYETYKASRRRKSKFKGHNNKVSSALEVNGHEQNENDLNQTETETAPPTVQSQIQNTCSRTTSEIKLSSSASYDLKPNFTDPQYRIVDLQCIVDCFNTIHKSFCPKANIKLEENLTSRHGLQSVFSVSCTNCEFQTTFITSSNIQQTKQRDINLRSSYAFTEIGNSREALATVCSILNMPPPVQSNVYNTNVGKIHQATTEAVDEHLRQARETVRNLYLQGNPDREATIDIPVTFDGTWSKRGYTANFGVGFVMSVDTGQVLDYHVLSKQCSECKYWEKQDQESEAYQTWEANHDCDINYIGSSTGMEREAAKILWGRSMDLFSAR